MKVVNRIRPNVLNLLSKFMFRELSIKELNMNLFSIERALVELNNYDETLIFKFNENDSYKCMDIGDLLSDFRERMVLEDLFEIAIENPKSFNVILVN